MDPIDELWAAADPPRLPPDAPVALRAYTVDFYDPRAAYIVHHGLRRHNIGVLIEQLVLQLRDGCGNASCPKPNCFSCRRTLAGDRPIRKYNSTSARALAVHLASDQNPYRHLCPSLYPDHRQEVLEKPRGLDSQNGKKYKDIVRRKSNTCIRQDVRLDSTCTVPKGGGIKKEKVQDQCCTSSLRNSQNAEPSNSEELPEVTRVVLKPLSHGRDEKRDSKSFVQNIYNTTAFKMLEWLTPANYIYLCRGSSNHLTQELRACDQNTGMAEEKVAVHTTDGEEPRTTNHVPALTAADTPPRTESDSLAPSSGCRSPLTPESPLVVPCASFSEAESHMASSLELEQTLRAQRKTISSSKPSSPEAAKRQLVGRIAEPTSRKAASTPLCRSRKSETPQTTSQTFDLAGDPVAQACGPKPGTFSGAHELEQHRGMHSRHHRDVVTARNLEQLDGSLLTPDLNTPIRQERYNDSAKPTRGVVLPKRGQTLEHLNRDVMAVLHGVLRNDVEHDFQTCALHLPIGTIKSRSIEFQTPTNVLSQKGSTDIPCRSLCGTCSTNKGEALTIHGTRPPNLVRTPSWQHFLDQSLYHTLRDPVRLCLSFDDFDGTDRGIYDSQTITSNMSTLLDISKDVVFVSMTCATSFLFLPPPCLVREYWTSREPKNHSMWGMSISPGTTSRMVQLCLHALVAVVLNRTSRDHEPEHFESACRIRAAGQILPLTTQIGDKLVPELCIILHDTLLEEPALRFAKQVCAAIATQMQFSRTVNTNSRAYLSDQPGMVSDFCLRQFLQVTKDFEGQDHSILSVIGSQFSATPFILYMWATAVFQSGWTSEPSVNISSAQSGALSLMTAIYEQRDHFALSDVVFQLPFVEDRLTDMLVPVQWISFLDSTKKHLLDHAFLFSLTTRLQYFRAINMYRMSGSYEMAINMETRIHHTSSPSSLLVDPTQQRHLNRRLDRALEPFLVLVIRRSHILEDAFSQLWRRERRELLKPLKVRLGEGTGEEGLDSGGVQHEFMRLAIAQAMAVDYGMFTVDQRTRMAWFQPSSAEPSWKFEMIGLLFSIAVYNSLTLPVTLPMVFYAKLLGRPVKGISSIRDGWPDVAKGLQALLEWDEDKDGTIEDVFCRTYEFSAPIFAEVVTREMARGHKWPNFAEVFRATTRQAHDSNVKMVTRANRDQYVKDYIQWLTDITIRPQFEAFKKGFLHCLDPKSLQLFCPNTLCALIAGQQHISVSDLRAATLYETYTETCPYIEDFWDIVSSYSQNQLRHLLEFVTASDRVPAGGASTMQFEVRKNGEGGSDAWLPTAYTCYGILLLPEYSSKEVLREKLGMAINNARGFGFA